MGDKGVLIKKLCYIDKEFEKYKEQENIDYGYIFMIKNDLYSVYNEPIIMLDYGIKKSIDERYNKKYLKKISLIRSIKIPYVELVYKLLLIILNEYRIVKNKNFLINNIDVKKELDMLGIHFKKKDGLESYINYIITTINKKYGSIINLKNRLNEKKIIPIKCINSKENVSQIKIKKKDSLEKINEYESSIRKYGFIVLIESEEIEKYYKGEITYIIVSDTYKEQIESMFIKEPKIHTYRVYNYEMCELMVKDMLKNENISNGYYMCKKEKGKEKFELIKEYYEKNNQVENLKKSYLYGEYKIGKKVNEEIIKDKIKNIDYINIGKESRHKKIIERMNEKKEKKEIEIDEEELYKMLIGTKEEIKEPIERKSRYELACKRLEKIEKK